MEDTLEKVAEPEYRKIFREAAEHATGPARPLFQDLVNLWDHGYAKLFAIVSEYPQTEGNFYKMVGRMYKEAARDQPKWKAAAARLDALAKTDPQTSRVLKEMRDAQAAYIRSCDPRR